MKITVKTTQQKVFQIDAEPSDTVAVLKSKIESSQSHPVASQKIIYSGKILADDKTVESCGIKEKDFLVLMVSKPKPTPAATTSTTPAPAAQAPAAAAPPPTTESTPAAAPASDAPASSAPATQPAQERAFGDTSSFLSGSALQDTINNMVEMGFPKDQVLRAMRASFNNPDRAVEYLMTGIPSHLEGEASGNAGGAQARSGAAPAAGAGAGADAAAAAPASAPPPANQPQNLFQLAQNQQQSGGGGGGGSAGTGGFTSAQGQHIDIEALRNNPQIQQLREHIQSNPESAQAVIQQLAAQYPQLIQAFAQNPDAFIRLLDLDPQSMAPPGAQVINVTEEERAAIERLEAFGFPRHKVVEAYLACDKDETMAANYLFEHGYEDDDDN
ncbi:UV excision repair protein rad23 [Marasmius crinis-equi]|uniref:UV excision repair protein RAD23 n=1 Tax=Marasmius crinis-equi TaxID=585013 RepID=A0ABR3FJM9_9AGAR